ncbi:MAG: peptidoglycan-binding domain-containing protein [Christensenellales bacterium]|jgi:peptidoglycan hydrolase-like protein with peptidoglycan-binding domain
MKNMKKFLALALVAMTVLAVAVPALALTGGYNAAARYLNNVTLKPDWPQNNSTAVENLQRMLDALGYDPGPFDGIYGPLTKNAVLAFQQAHSDLTNDGICGKYTKIKIWETLSSVPSYCVPLW